MRRTWENNTNFSQLHVLRGLLSLPGSIYAAVSDSPHLQRLLIAFRHIDGEPESASPICAKLFDLPYTMYMQLKAFDGIP